MAYSPFNLSSPNLGAPSFGALGAPQRKEANLLPGIYFGNAKDSDENGDTVEIKQKKPKKSKRKHRKEKNNATPTPPEMKASKEPVETSPILLLEGPKNSTSNDPASVNNDGTAEEKAPSDKPEGDQKAEETSETKSTKKTEAPDEATETDESNETKSESSEPKKKMSWLSIAKSIAVTVAGVALIALPVVLFPVAATAGVWAFTKAVLASIPFLVAKDMMDDYVKDKHVDVDNLSDLKVMREVLDKKMDGFLKKAVSYVPFADDDTKEQWKGKLMGIYENRISGFLEKMSSDVGVSSLIKDTPDKLKEADGLFGKGEVLIAAVGTVLKFAFLSNGRIRIMSLAKRGGAIGFVFAGVLWAYNQLFEEQADKFDKEFKEAKEKEANKAKEARKTSNSGSEASAAA